MDNLDILGCFPPYSDYDTPVFKNIFASAEEFAAALPAVYADYLEGVNLKLVYTLLYSRYANSHIANSDTEQFKNKLYTIIFNCAPAWSKRLELQNKLRNLTDDELMTGSKAIYNQAYNPNTEPSTDTLNELPFINTQNTTKHRKSKLEAYATLYQVLDADVSSEFLNKFKGLFVSIIIPRPVYEKED